MNRKVSLIKFTYQGNTYYRDPYNHSIWDPNINFVGVWNEIPYMFEETTELKYFVYEK